MAFVAAAEMVADCWLRPRNIGPAPHACGFLDNTLHRLGSKRVSLVRADSGSKASGTPLAPSIYPLTSPLAPVDNKAIGKLGLISANLG
jgi:hypothetical protein